MDAGTTSLAAFLFTLFWNLALENCLSFLEEVDLVESMSMRSSHEELLQGQDLWSTCFFLFSLSQFVIHGKNQHVTLTPNLHIYQ